jgi:hypothetical protein
MTSDSRRYHNVFYAFRGSASGDPVGGGPRQLENSVTKALINTLEHGGPELTSSFARKVARVDVRAGAFEFGLEVTHRPAPAENTVLLGLSPAGRVEPGSLRTPHGESRVDALIEAPGALRILVESKIVGGNDGDQLWRHARAWGQPEPERSAGRWRQPDNWRMRSWADVQAWGAEELGSGASSAVGGFLLQQLLEYLDLCGLMVDRQRSRHGRSAATAGDDGRAAIVPLIRDVDLAEVRRICARLYGSPAAPFHVTGSSCRADSRRIVDDAGRHGASPPPEVLQGGRPADVITPRRALSILYGPERYEQSVAPKSDTSGARKYLNRGIDRCALLGMVAWADTSPTAYATYVRRLAARAWPDAPVAGHANGELVEALRTAGISP